KPVFNPHVNQWWMCDDGRLLYHVYDKLNRIEYPSIRKDGELQRSHWRMTLKEVLRKLKEFPPATVAVVGSGYATNEENFMLQKFAREGLGTEVVAIDDTFPREDDLVYKRFTIKGEKVPNYQGALDMLQPQETLSGLLKKIDSGEIKALYFLGGGPDFTLTDEMLNTLKKLDYLVVEDIKYSPLTEIAHVVLAGASAYEKEGTFTNYQKHVQRIRAAIMPPRAAKTDFEILHEFFDLLEMPKFLRPKQVFAEITSTIKEYEEMDFSQLGDWGISQTSAEKAEAAS
ncbi:MAG: hypothetical protein D6732_09260, partial [Methanobacteriota archaeon]